MNEQYEAYGDVNPLEHGGSWVKRADNRNIYEFDIIKVQPIDDALEGHELRLSDCRVDITDTWINISSVREYCDVNFSNHKMFALAVVDMYGAENCGGTSKDLSAKEVEDWLHINGIEV